MFKNFDLARIHCRMYHRDVAKHAVDIDSHLFFGKVLNELHVTIADSIHKRIPVIGCRKLVDEMRESVEEVDDLLSIALL